MRGTYWTEWPVIGVCDCCGREVCRGEHFYKQNDGSYACEACDFLAMQKIEQKNERNRMRCASSEE